MYRGRRAIAGLAAVATFSLSIASADSQKPIIVMESHVGDRPAAFVPLLGAIEDQLEARGAEARLPELLLLAGKTVARPGVLDLDLTAQAIVKELTDGYSAFAQGDCTIAIPKLQKGLAEVDRNPQLLVNDTTNLDATFDAYVALGVCLKLANDSSYADVFAALLRRFPLRPVSRQTPSGPRGESLWVQAQTAQAGVPRGRLSIAAGSTEAAIFVFDQARQTGHALLADIAPGIYSVFIWVKPNVGRQYLIDVRPNEEARLDIDPDFDAALIMREWVGFQYADAATAKREQPMYAATAATRWTGRRDAIVLATWMDDTRPAIDGIYYRDGTELRHARLYLDETKPSDAEALAVFLTAGTVGGNLHVVMTDAAPAPRDRITDSPRDLRYVLPSIVLGAGVVAGTAGIVLQATKQPPSTPPAPEYLVSTPGVVLMATGGLAACAGAYLLARASKHRLAPPLTLLSIGVGTMLAGGVLVGLSEQPTAAPRGQVQQEYYWDARSPGEILLGVGAAIAVVGGVAWVVGRRDRDHAAPVVELAPSGVVAGWSGHF